MPISAEEARRRSLRTPFVGAPPPGFSGGASGLVGAYQDLRDAYEGMRREAQAIERERAPGIDPAGEALYFGLAKLSGFLPSSSAATVNVPQYVYAMPGTAPVPSLQPIQSASAAATPAPTPTP